jgi:PKD repeat protein
VRTVHRASRGSSRLGVEQLEDRRLLDGAAFHFDLGTNSSPPEPGYVEVPLIAYSSATGYGWQSLTGLKAVDRGTGSNLTRDLHMGAKATFLVDLPNGAYDVTVGLGDASGKRNPIAILAEGNSLASGLRTEAGQFIQPKFRVQVIDGQLNLKIKDTDGSQRKFSLYSLDIQYVVPLTVDAGPDQSAAEGSSVPFRGSATGNGELAIQWDFGDGNSTSGTLTPSHTYADNGLYTVTLTVTDADGIPLQDQATVTVANVAPTANLGNKGPIPANTQVDVLFTNQNDVSSADVAAGFSYSYDWENDGVFDVIDVASASRPHAFPSPGAYTVAGRIKDKDGGSTDYTTIVTVNDAPPAPGDFIQTPWDKIPNFGKNATIVSIHNGPWSDPATWSEGRLPQAGDIVVITGSTTVTYDLVSDEELKALVVYPGAQFVFRTDISTRIVATHYLVVEGGTLQVGTGTDPVSADVKAELIVANNPLDTAADPEQYGNGLVVLGKVTMHGAVKADAFIRLATEPQAEDTTLQLSQPAAGWRVGDRLVLPDSRQQEASHQGYTFQYEEATIEAISADGLTVSLAAPLQFSHPGARNGDGVLEFLPHVGNRTRNVVVRSASSSGTRGHAFFTYRADVDIRYTSFGGLGRTTIDPIDNTTFDSDGSVTHVGTNQEGRNPVHFAHLIGPQATPANGYQYTFVGNAVFCAMPSHRFKWGIAIDDSHYGLVQNNFVYNWAGAGIVTQRGHESYNVIEHNFVVRGIGEGDRAGSGKPGDEGQAFWFRGPVNYVRDNVGANFAGSQIESAYGFKYYFVYLGNIRIPNYKGADISVDGQYTIKDGNATPILEFARNEAYGVESGLTYWWVNTFGAGYPNSGGESVLRDFRVWHPFLYGGYGYETNGLTIDGFTVRGSGVAGLFIGDYYTKDFTLTHADIQGMEIGISRPSTNTAGSTFTVRDSYFRNVIDINVGTLYTSAYRGDWIPPRTTVIQNVKFDALPGKQHLAINMNYDLRDVVNLILRDDVFVYDYDQIPGADFQLYYAEQRPDFILPQSTFNADGTLRRVGSPEEGLTNEQNWTKYGIALAGAVAPPDAIPMEEIGGLSRWL